MATGASSGALRRWAIRWAAWRSASSASSRARAGGAGLAVGGVALRVGLLDAGAGALDRRERGLLGLRGGLDGADQLVAAVALGQHAVLAAGGDLAQLARARRPHAAVAGDGDAVEAGIDRVDVVDDPDAGEQRGGEPRGAARRRRR